MPKISTSVVGVKVSSRSRHGPVTVMGRRVGCSDAVLRTPALRRGGGHGGGQPQQRRARDPSSVSSLGRRRCVDVVWPSSMSIMISTASAPRSAGQGEIEATGKTLPVVARGAGSSSTTDRSSGTERPRSATPASTPESAGGLRTVRCYVNFGTSAIPLLGGRIVHSSGPVVAGSLAPDTEAWVLDDSFGRVPPHRRGLAPVHPAVH